MTKHSEYCQQHDSVKITLPPRGSYLKFKNYNRHMKVPFVIYADFECFTVPISSCQPDPRGSYTTSYQRHTPSGFCFFVKSDFYKAQPVTFTKTSEGEDVGKIFVERLETTVRQIYQMFKFQRKMIYLKKDKKDFEEALNCHICNEFLFDDRVRDHCHYTGKYRGAAHNKCNLQFRKPKFIPVILHNLKGYDSHLFIKSLGLSEGKIDCIPNNEERYISFSKNITVCRFEKDGKEINVTRQLRFLDSFGFMSASLSNLVNNLEKDMFHTMSEEFTKEELPVLLRKGVYPYDYVNSLARLRETKLPPHKAFYSQLNDENISEDDYNHALNVWRSRGMKTIRDYHDLYLKCDTLLLADVFEQFRVVCMENYTLDPCWYFTSPGLAFDAMLKITGVKLELLTDPDMLLMIEKGIRGGVSMISNRYCYANNKYMGDAYKKNEEDKFITYLDANNLYGWAMCRPLPTDSFEWMTIDELGRWKDIPCILEVDLMYPDKLHDSHNDYPLAPESLRVCSCGTPHTGQECWGVLSGPPKLIPTLYDKRAYIIHYDNLKLYLKMGMKLTRIRRGIKFNESSFMKTYIDLNTNLRAKGKNDFEKDFFKLMNNAVYGKTLENIRSRVDIRLVSDEKTAKKLSVKPNYKFSTIFNENLIAVHMKKTYLLFNKPIYLEFTILDQSKTLIYDFHYNYMRQKYVNPKLLFTDTDSLMYELKTNDFYKDISEDVEKMFDTSNFPKVHPSGIKCGINKKVIGMFKDEAGGKSITEFVGLRAKLYSFNMYEGGKLKPTKKCKGVKKSVTDKTICIDDYKKCLKDGVEQMRSMKVIRSEAHQLYSQEVNKVALSSSDDKRHILEDGISTLAHGHHALR